MSWLLAGRPCRLVVREASVVEHTRCLLRTLMRLTYARADCVVSLAPEVTRSIIAAQVCVKEKIVEIGNPAVFRPYDNQAPDLSFLPSSSTRFICAVGSLKHAKGFDILLEGFARVSDTSLNLVILGEGELRTKLEKQCQMLKIEKRVHLPGFHRWPVEVIRHSELFVLSSRWEGFPNVLVEALSAGVPIVAADCPGAPRSILENGRHGHLFETGNISALVNAIEEALVNPVGSPEARRARAEAFGARAITEKYLVDAFCLGP